MPKNLFEQSFWFYRMHICYFTLASSCPSPMRSNDSLQNKITAIKAHEMTIENTICPIFP